MRVAAERLGHSWRRTWGPRRLCDGASRPNHGHRDHAAVITLSIHEKRPRQLIVSKVSQDFSVSRQWDSGELMPLIPLPLRRPRVGRLAAPSIKPAGLPGEFLDLDAARPELRSPV